MPFFYVQGNNRSNLFSRQETLHVNKAKNLKYIIIHETISTKLI